jgi:hypothetical protein
MYFGCFWGLGKSQNINVVSFISLSLKNPKSEGGVRNGSGFFVHISIRNR